MCLNGKWAYMPFFSKQIQFFKNQLDIQLTGLVFHRKLCLIYYNHDMLISFTHFPHFWGKEYNINNTKEIKTVLPWVNHQRKQKALIVPLVSHFTILGQMNMQNMPLYFKIEQGKNMDRNDWPDLSFLFHFLDMIWLVIKNTQVGEHFACKFQPHNGAWKNTSQLPNFCTYHMIKQSNELYVSITGFSKNTI